MLRLHLFLVALIAASSPTSARADRLDLKQLPQKLAWVVHVDVEAAASSTVAQTLRESWLGRGQIHDAIEKVHKATGMDPTREIRSITVYGMAFAPEHVVVIVRGQ